MSNYIKKWVRMAIDREKTYTCKAMLSHDVKVCKVERMIENNCMTCPLNMVRDSVMPDHKLHGSGDFESVRFVTNIPTIPSWILGVK